MDIKLFFHSAWLWWLSLDKALIGSQLLYIIFLLVSFAVILILLELVFCLIKLNLHTVFSDTEKGSDNNVEKTD